jgi:hypothetical protein
VFLYSQLPGINKNGFSIKNQLMLEMPVSRKIHGNPMFIARGNNVIVFD